MKALFKTHLGERKPDLWTTPLHGIHGEDVDRVEAKTATEMPSVLYIV